ncbi:MAG TPA: short-chain dehydrogenase [Puia sp.]|jgi:hypothetical protein
MTNKQIEDFFVNNKAINRTIKIAFKSRNPVEGIFIETRDYDELKSKNFWRIVSNTHVDNYKKTKDINLSRIFNGSEMTKLSCL